MMVNCERAEVGLFPGNGGDSSHAHALKIPQLSTAFGVQRKNKNREVKSYYFAKLMAEEKAVVQLRFLMQQDQLKLT